MPERGASDTFGARLAEALAGPPPGAPTREVWSVLGAAGLTAEVYDRRAAAWQVRPGRLAACLAALDARGATGVTLGCCVQLATVVP
ncbi:MAG TPA: hypothetical protein VNV66_16895, partial [Pilimelia sp.]|nr:hypothetical protein [Pilimelia sp.]